MENKKLLFSLTKKDFKVEIFKSSGAGGQNRNRRLTAVRITHPESGAVGECSEQRHQLQNKKTAFERLVKSPKFRLWHSRRCHEIITGETLEEKVEKSIIPKNLKVEFRTEGEWITQQM